jgi:NAD(P)-dependent dehydrogenase (short-subunit alcohol dehydrogenase family)
VKRWVDGALMHFGRLDIAVNNAGGEGQLGPIVAQSESNYDDVFDVNVKGLLFSLKHEITAMQAHGGGEIVNVSSIVGQVGMAGASVYTASKRAVNGLTRTAALETAKLGIRVNAVAPGAICTPMMERFTGADKNAQAGFAAAHPVGRTGQAEEVAEAVLYLAGDSGKCPTGSILNIDGGYTAQWGRRAIRRGRHHVAARDLLRIADQACRAFSRVARTSTAPTDWACAFPRQKAGMSARYLRCTRFATRPVHPVWCIAPRPSPVSP